MIIIEQVPSTVWYQLNIVGGLLSLGPLLLWTCEHWGNPNVGFNIVTISYVIIANINLYIK